MIAEIEIEIESRGFLLIEGKFFHILDAIDYLSSGNFRFERF